MSTHTHRLNNFDPRDRLGEIEKMSDAEKASISMQARQAAEAFWQTQGGDRRPLYVRMIGQYLAAKAEQTIREQQR